ncbi:MAG: ribosomal RNA small subunit methyltransferase A [Rhodobiaceae bacterium]|nr:ribosomal RNA small subunit methyltransferase A [Rhodobiaceae bacterium]
MQKETSKISEYKKLLEDFDIRPNKKLGQNFIFDENIFKKIALTIDPQDCDLVIEIGPGLGGLTRSLLKLGARKVLLIEKDKKFIPILSKLQVMYPNQIEIINADVMNYSFASLTEKKIRIISNLPYNIGTKILTKLLLYQYTDPKFDKMTLMFQKEVANRIIAKKKSKTYGRLSIISQYMYECAVSFDLKAKCFYPAPKVDSSVVTFNYLNSSLRPNIEVVQEITRLAFGQRRKKIKSSLKNIISEENLIKKYKLNPDLRPEDLSVEDYIKLSYLYEKG